MKPTTKRLGQAGYVKCLRVIALGGGKTTQHTLRASTKINRNTAIRFCHCLHDLRLIHVAGWDVSGRYPMPQYALGDGEDAPHPTGKPRPRQNKRGMSIELVSFTNMVRAIQAMPQHGRGLHLETGVSERTTRVFLKAMHAARLAYIAEFEDRGPAGAGAALYAFGLRKRDAVKPEPISRAEQHRRQTAMRQRRRADIRAHSAVVNGWTDRRNSTYRRTLAQASAPESETAGVPA